MSESNKVEPDPHRYRKQAPRLDEGPIELPLLMAGEGPVELDIGFGRGMSIFTRAARAPEARIVGIEIKSKWACKVRDRVASEHLDRVCILCGDAREMLSRSGPDACVERAFVHFPDPWWKKKHSHRFVVGEMLLTELARLFVPGGELFIQTDVEDRSERYAATLREHSAFGEVERLFENRFGAISNRERRAIEDGLPIYRLLVRRAPQNADLAP